MKVYITGANGYIGKHLLKVGCKPLTADITDQDAFEREIVRVQPELVLHLAGASNPDWCEDHIDESVVVNVRATSWLMGICADHHVPAVLLSSDQIWGGGWWEHLWNKHYENSRLTPAVNTYGMCKTAAEGLTLYRNDKEKPRYKVIRGSYVFNKDRLQASLDDLKHGVSVDAPTFLHRSFIHMDDFVYLLSEYCKRFYSMPPVLHLAGSRRASWAAFWTEVCKQFGFDPKLVRARKKEQNALHSARRPHYGGLNVALSDRLGFRIFDYVGGIGRMKEEK